jgi:hypothetical protein
MFTIVVVTECSIDVLSMLYMPVQFLSARRSFTFTCYSSLLRVERVGQPEVLEWVPKYGHPVTEGTCFAAASGGQLATLQRIRAHLCVGGVKGRGRQLPVVGIWMGCNGGKKSKGDFRLKSRAFWLGWRHLTRGGVLWKLIHIPVENESRRSLRLSHK